VSWVPLMTTSSPSAFITANCEIRDVDGVCIFFVIVVDVDVGSVCSVMSCPEGVPRISVSAWRVEHVICGRGGSVSVSGWNALCIADVL